jgi:hypothetical protein
MGRAPYEDIFPLRGRALCYQVAISVRGEVLTRWHRDFDGDEWVREPAKLQGTLFLSTPGVDYTGDGFTLETNSGDTVRFGHEVKVACGDLVLWRYCNRHSVLNIDSSGAQCGFIRVLFPTEQVGERPAERVEPEPPPPEPEHQAAPSPPPPAPRRSWLNRHLLTPARRIIGTRR